MTAIRSAGGQPLPTGHAAKFLARCLGVGMFLAECLFSFTEYVAEKLFGFGVPALSCDRQCEHVAAGEG